MRNGNLRGSLDNISNPKQQVPAGALTLPSPGPESRRSSWRSRWLPLWGPAMLVAVAYLGLAWLPRIQERQRLAASLQEIAPDGVGLGKQRSELQGRIARAKQRLAQLQESTQASQTPKLVSTASPPARSSLAGLPQFTPGPVGRVARIVHILGQFQVQCIAQGPATPTAVVTNRFRNLGVALTTDVQGHGSPAGELYPVKYELIGSYVAVRDALETIARQIPEAVVYHLELHTSDPVESRRGWTLEIAL